MSQLCEAVERTRQAYHKQAHQGLQLELWDQRIIDEVKKIRARQPRVGTRKLHRMLNERLKADGIEVGRDHLFELLRAHNLLIRRRRCGRRTTDSRHRLEKYKNQIQGLELTRPNQVYVADITYLDTLEGFCYLALLTDAYSRKIVGYDLSVIAGVILPISAGLLFPSHVTLLRCVQFVFYSCSSCFLLKIV